MKHKFNQMVVAPKVGDCLKSAVASFLGVHYDMVPHFILYGEAWFRVYHQFLWSIGYEFNGQGTLKRHDPEKHNLDGYLLATVNSRTMEGRTHAVVCNAKTGIVEHDPGESKRWEGEEIIKSGLILRWDLIDRRADDEWEKAKEQYHWDEIEELFMEWDGLLKCAAS